MTAKISGGRVTVLSEVSVSIMDEERQERMRSDERQR